MQRMACEEQEQIIMAMEMRHERLRRDKKCGVNPDRRWNRRSGSSGYSHSVGLRSQRAESESQNSVIDRVAVARLAHAVQSVDSRLSCIGRVRDDPFLLVRRPLLLLCPSSDLMDGRMERQRRSFGVNQREGFAGSPVHCSPHPPS